MAKHLTFGSLRDELSLSFSSLPDNRQPWKTDYSIHDKVLQAEIMHPDKKQVIPLMPEEIRNTDGNKKQDCEVNAGKRLIKYLKKDHPRVGLIITGDDLLTGKKEQNA